MSRDDERRSRVSAFTRLTEPWHRPLFGFAVGLCKDRDLAADLTQETLVRAFEAFHRFKPGAPVFPWLARILRNHYIDQRRSGRARFEVLVDSDDPTHAPPSTGDDPLAYAERTQLRGWLREEIERLPKDQRVVVTLCDVCGFSYEEAAEAAEIPLGTVRSRLSRARLVLRKRLQGRRREGSSEQTKRNRRRS